MPADATNRAADFIPVQQEHRAQPTAWPALVVGFGAAVTMWILWYGLHLPSVRVTPAIAAIVLLLTLLGAVGVGTRGLGSHAPRVGLAAGLVAGLINLLLLGSKLSEAGTEPGDSSATLIPQAPLIVVGFLVACMAMGAAGGWLGRVFGRRTRCTSETWLARFAIIAVVALAPLIAIGGAVTSSGAGLSVPDWPGTYGSNMFLYPIGLMADPYIFLEHTHRLFGTLVGLTVLTLMVAVVRSRASRATKTLAVVVFLLVCVQGLLGGIRVTEIDPKFGVVHGILAQLILGSAAILAAMLTSTWQTHASQPKQTGTAAALAKRYATIAAVVLLIQLTLAALYRHTGAQHALWSHIGFAIFVTVAVALLGFALQQADGYSDAGRTLRRIGSALIIAVCVQFVLGFAAWGSGGQGGPDRVVATLDIGDAAPPELGLTVFATAHQANGAFLLALTALSLAWTRRLAPDPS